MNTIGTLYVYELKKIGNRKVVWIVGPVSYTHLDVYKRQR